MEANNRVHTIHATTSLPHVSPQPAPLHQQHQHQQQQPLQPGQTKARMMSPLPAWARFYFYGMHGVLDEVVFTALFDLAFEPAGNPQLKGYTTITSFFMYGGLRFLMEYCFLYCIHQGHSLKARLVIYVLAVYVWEFSWGLCLRQFNACSWDYSHYPLNLLGLITLLYAPAWFLLCLFQDYMYRYVFRVHVLHGETAAAAAAAAAAGATAAAAAAARKSEVKVKVK